MTQSVITRPRGVESLITGQSTSKVCTRCTGSLRNQPLLGLRILSGMKRSDRLNFEGGEIIYSDEGKVYKCHIRLSEDGKTIEVTGYIGFNWFGQSEIWGRTNLRTQ